MFIHLGGDCVIKIKNIIAILDMESTLKSRDSNNFLKEFIKKGSIEDISDNDEPRSLILVERIDDINEKNEKSVIYKSPISASTLLKRAAFIDDFYKIFIKDRISTK